MRVRSRRRACPRGREVEGGCLVYFRSLVVVGPRIVVRATHAPTHAVALQDDELPAKGASGEGDDIAGAGCILGLLGGCKGQVDGAVAALGSIL